MDKKISINRIKKSVAVIVFSTIVLSVIIMYSDIQAIWEMLCKIKYQDLLIIGVLIPCNYFIKCIRYHYYLYLVGIKVAFSDEVVSLFSSFVMVITPGKLGEMLLRGYILKERGYEISGLTVCSMTLADRLTEGMAMLLLSALTMVGFDGIVNLWAMLMVGAGMSVIVYILQNKEFVYWLISKIENMGNRAKKMSQWGLRAYEEANCIFTLGPIIISTLMGVLAWLCEAGVIYYVIRAVGSEISLVQAIFAVSLSGIIGAISMIPGGIGIADGTIFGILLLSGVTKPIASIATILSRFSTMWLGVFLGCIVLIIYQIKKQK